MQKSRHVRLGGMTDTYTYLADGVGEMEYPRPNPEPIARLLHGLREDERLGILHTDGNQHHRRYLEEAEAILKTLVATLSDGAVLSFGVESADPAVHEANWLNCDRPTEGRGEPDQPLRARARRARLQNCSQASTSSPVSTAKPTPMASTWTC